MAGLPICPRVFLYGTLLPGQCRAPLVERLGGRSIGPATSQGWLLDLGAYPGLVTEDWLRATGLPPPPSALDPPLPPWTPVGPADQSRATPETHAGNALPGRVQGLCVEFPAPHAALAELDAEEECRLADTGFDQTGRPMRIEVALGEGLYVRRLQPIRLQDGSEVWAWAYHYNHREVSPRWIASGNWRQR